ncbi:YciI family protein [Nocardia sp. CA-107356]|uniref:YciI family protein n=1 Tax=Nocardia sp. CA-107356 TaxID=3239972 RepID=UPI003D9429B8
MPEYLLLIHQDEYVWEHTDPDTYGRVMRGHHTFETAHANRLRGGARLRSSSAARSVRHDQDGALVVTDGAFTESKEVLGGFYLIEAPDQAEAARIAADLPSPFGIVEVRPVRPDDDGRADHR